MRNNCPLLTILYSRRYRKAVSYFAARKKSANYVPKSVTLLLSQKVTLLDLAGLLLHYQFQRRGDILLHLFALQHVFRCTDGKLTDQLRLLGYGSRQVAGFDGLQCIVVSVKADDHDVFARALDRFDCAQGHFVIVGKIALASGFP